MLSSSSLFGETGSGVGVYSSKLERYEHQLRSKQRSQASGLKHVGP